MRAGGKGTDPLECLTYRFGDHTTADDASRYRSREQVEHWKRKDPIERLRKYMESGLLNKAYDQAVRSEAKEKVESAVHEEESFPPPDPLDMFRFTYEDLPADLREQMEGFVNANGRRDQREWVFPWRNSPLSKHSIWR